MKSLERPGAKAILQHRLHHYVEFLTNWDPTHFIEPDQRSHELFIEFFSKECTFLGNRGSSLVWEPNEEDQWMQGIYDYECKTDGKVSLWHNFEADATKNNCSSEM